MSKLLLLVYLLASCPGVASTTRGATNGDSFQMQTNNTRYKSVPLSLKPAFPGVVVIPLTKGFFTIVDECDYHLVGDRHWQVGTFKNYRCAVATINHKTVKMHRMIIGASKGQIVDHINRDALDNRRSNLRFATLQQNSANLIKPGSIGAYRRKRGDKYVVRVRCGDGIRKYIGTYDTVEEASLAYRAAHADIHKEWSPYFGGNV